MNSTNSFEYVLFLSTVVEELQFYFLRLIEFIKALFGVIPTNFLVE